MISNQLTIFCTLTASDRWVAFLSRDAPIYLIIRERERKVIERLTDSSWPSGFDQALSSSITIAMLTRTKVTIRREESERQICQWNSSSFEVQLILLFSRCYLLFAFDWARWAWVCRERRFFSPASSCSIEDSNSEVCRSSVEFDKC